ncbi:DMT family transporter [Micromonospora zhanjiangensis]
MFAFLAQTWAVQRTSASRASLLLGTEPVWAVVAGIALGGERLTVLATLGAGLMVAGTYWGQAVERAHRTRTRTRTRTSSKENGTCRTPTPTSA